MKVLFTRILLFSLIAFGLTQALRAAEEPYRWVKDIAYRNGDLTDSMKERCRLDLYCPRESHGFATVVWFHGGGLTGGAGRFQMG